jgi:RimJ/RimL family protein N-acetyltransferase
MIEGARINLRRPTRADIPKLLEWQGEEEIFHLGAASRLQSEKELEREISNPSSRPNRLLFIIETRESAPIGYIQLHTIRWKDRNGELGIVIGEKEFWNKLYGVDTYTAFLDYAFNTLNMHKIYGVVAEYNERHIRLIEKAEGKKEGTLKEHLFRDGKYYDMYIYGFLKSYYQETKKKSENGLKRSWVWRKK